MKCISRILCIIVVAALLTGCGASTYEMPYDPDYGVSSYRVNVCSTSEKADAYAKNLCVSDANYISNPSLDMENVSAVGLFDLNKAETLYGKNLYTQLAPASLTKIMTALVALKYGSPDQVLTASENVKITEANAQLCGIKPGDQMTLNQALHILLIYSANDVAVMVAEGVGGSVEAFCGLMNKEANAIGATGCNFMNPNGLTQENHYVTAYDMYLIFNEALKYELFNEIIQTNTYTTVYTLANGNSKELTVNTTNRYLKDSSTTKPDQITVIGGKTGTTAAAGHCLILLSRDSTGSPYISIILNSDSTDSLYKQMSDLLSEIDK